MVAGFEDERNEALSLSRLLKPRSGLEFVAVVIVLVYENAR